MQFEVNARSLKQDKAKTIDLPREYVWIKEFEGGGLAIGLSCIHLLSDPICATMFLKAPFPFPPRKPVNEISYHRPYTALINHYKFLIENSTPFLDAKHTTKISLALSDCMIRACMDMVQSTSAPNKPSPSPFKALAGLLWVCISKVRGLRNGL
ncbi:protein ECERIFERUM 26-like [Fagus crenata]